MKKPFNFCGQDIFPDSVHAFELRPEVAGLTTEIPTNVSVTFKITGSEQNVISYRITDSDRLDFIVQAMDELKKMAEERKEKEKDFDDAKREVDLALSYVEHIGKRVQKIKDKITDVINGDKKFVAEVVSWRGNKKLFSNNPLPDLPDNIYPSEYHIMSFDKYKRDVDTSTIEDRFGEDIIYGTSGAMCRWKNDWRRVLLKSEEKLVQKYMTEAQEIVLSKAEGLRRMLLRQLADCKPEDVVVITDEES